MNDRKELIKLVRFCRKYGLKSLKTADVEIVLGDPPPKKVGEVGVNKRIFALPGLEDPDAKMPTDDDLLFFATGHFDERQTDKRTVK